MAKDIFTPLIIFLIIGSIKLINLVSIQINIQIGISQTLLLYFHHKGNPLLLSFHQTRQVYSRQRVQPWVT